MQKIAVHTFEHYQNALPLVKDPYNREEEMEEDRCIRVIRCYVLNNTYEACNYNEMEDISLIALHIFDFKRSRIACVCKYSHRKPY